MIEQKERASIYP